MKITVEYNGVTSVCELPARIDAHLESFLDCSKTPARIMGDIIILEAAKDLQRQAKMLREEVYPPERVATVRPDWDGVSPVVLPVGVKAGKVDKS